MSKEKNCFVIYPQECKYEKNRKIIKDSFTLEVIREVRPNTGYDKNLRYFATASKNRTVVLIFTKAKKWREPYKYLEFLLIEEFDEKYEFIDE